jgi:ribonuclease P protein component
MLNKKHRLAKTTDVQKALSRGRAFFNPYFNLKFLSFPEKKRFTVVVSTKVSKKAVVRNRIKRIIREFIRLRLENFASGDYAVMVKPSLAKIEEKNITLLFEEFLARTKLVRP